MEHRLVLPSPVGELTLTEENGALTGLYFGARPGGEEGPSPLLEEAARQLQAYFAGQRQAFSLPLAPRGTAFQLPGVAGPAIYPLWGGAHLWGDCRAIGKPKACRAVGMANHNNPISIIVPCHRVVGADGSLTGYGGGLAAKEFLLALEQGGRPSSLI